MTEPSSPEFDRLPAWVPPVVFAALTVLAFRAYLLSPPGSILIGQDTLAAGVMMRSFFVDQFHALGRLPLWNPLLYGGVPTIEAGSGDILYPPSFALHMLLPLVPALAWKLILHVFLAGFAMYGCARAFGTSRLVALLAGVSWLLSPNLVSLVFGGQDGKMYVITLFPAALGLLVSALNRPAWFRFVWTGAAAGLLLIAHPQLAFYAWVTLGGYALAALLVRRRDGSRLMALRLGGGVVSLITALGVAAVVLVPMYRYLRHDSPRAGAGKGVEWAASYALNPEEVVNFVLPDFSGVDETYWGRNPLKHNSEYGGVVMFALGIAALIALKGDRRRIGLGVTAGVALIYALGATTPAFRLLYYAIPPLRNFRAPSLATFVALTALTLLASLLLERILRQREGPEARTAVKVLAVVGGATLLLGILIQTGGAGALGWWFALVGSPARVAALESNIRAMALGGVLSAVWCGFALGALLAWRRGILGAAAVVGLLTAVTAIDLLRVDSRYVQTAPYEQFFPPDPFEALRQQLGPGERVLPFPGSLPGGGQEGGYLATYRIPEVFGYHGNQLRWYDDFTRRDRRDGARTREEVLGYWRALLQGQVLNLLAVRVVIVPPIIPAPPGYETLGGNERLSVYRNPGALREATVVPAVTVVSDTAAQLDRVWDPTFAPAAEALTFEPIPQLGAAGGTGTAAVAGEGADSVAVTAETNGPALLLISRTWHPSWKATVGGQPAPVVRTDYALMGVPLAGAGRHEVVLRYRPSIVRTARRVSIAGWLLVLAASGIAFALQRRRSQAGA